MAIELARRGIEVLGVDIDDVMLDVARRRAPHLDWRVVDLSQADPIPAVLPRASFDLAVLAGNVMIFVAPGTEPVVVRNVSRSLAPGGRLLAGFQLHSRSWTLDDYDGWADEAGLALESRWATWDRQAWREGGDYAVSLHRLRDVGAAPV